jgi:hypothetical protein
MLSSENLKQDIPIKISPEATAFEIYWNELDEFDSKEIAYANSRDALSTAEMLSISDAAKAIIPSQSRMDCIRSFD